MYSRQAAAIAVLALSAATISACSGADYGIAALDRKATSEDQLPDFVSDPSLDIDSVRKVAEQNQISYFIGEMKDDKGFCAYATTGDDFIGGCGEGNGQLVTVSPGAGSDLLQFTLVTDSYSNEDLRGEGWTEVHDNILVR
ncbi:hypothetical protein [Arthrobacter sp. L77]|uniref:hypothetical protein n=1 Tax=Arthrobacter sp. L77 TaxID=1496689 RepID=UPI0005BBC03C|nr:hypothetical protein [Arthrobacter sp. L77]